MRALSLALFAVACAAMPASAQKFEVHVLPVESMDGLARWFQQKPAPSGVYPRAQELVLGKKIYFPILVTRLDPSLHGPLELVGDIEIVAPDGKSQVMKKCCRYSVADRSGIRTAILSNVPDFEMEATDKKGMYTLRTSVTDGQQTVAGTDQIRYGAPAKEPAAANPAASAKTAARPDSPAQSEPAQRRSFSHTDRSRCLDLPTQAEVIRCAEGK